MDGILLVDKPPRLSSHDVVACVRAALHQREVGHAGTLDPMATGLLVVLVGEATRLSAWLTLDRKRYVATVRFGVATHSLDADGSVTETSSVLPSRDEVLAALAQHVGDQMQVPPAVSAIKIDGVAMHERTRRGEHVELAPRPVTLLRAEMLDFQDSPRACTVDLTTSKGFYVRAFARDLAASLGTVAHLTALRRTESGAFTLSEAVASDVLSRAWQRDEDARKTLREKVLPVAAASRAMPVLTVDDDTAVTLSQGKRIPCEHPDGTVLVLRAGDVPVCVATVTAGVLSVARGFTTARPPAP